MKLKTQRYSHILNIAFEAVLVNKFRSLLTALGIIFGVAAVIAMLAIGSGAKQEIIEQMKLIGVNNIIIRPLSEDELQSQQDNSEDGQGENSSNTNFSPGLNLKDLDAIKSILPTVLYTNPEITYQTFVVNKNTRKKAQLTGITNSFFDIFNLELKNGQTFNNKHLFDGATVCVIGSGVATNVFKDEEPVGKWLKCNHLWLKVVGVLQQKNISTTASENLGITDYNNMVFAPAKTVLLRYKNRGKVSVSENYYYYSSNPKQDSKHQLDKIVIQVENTENMEATADVIERLLFRRHNKQKDFEIIIPELLLKQEQRTRDIFNIVLGAIASISLIVGGIGIMNIMLASVTERTKEIGVRLAIGAKKNDVVLQFISEATMISLSGGFFGIFLGALLAQLISKFADIPTIISPISILVSFGVSATVGIVFGYMPAKKAALKDPVSSLRYE